MTVRWQTLWLAGSNGLSPGFCGAFQVSSQRLRAVAGGDFGAEWRFGAGDCPPVRWARCAI